MNFLVTGGCGYIGTNLTNALIDKGHQVSVVDIMWFGNYLKSHKNLSVIQADIREIDKIPMVGVDTVIHLANIANDPTGDLNSKLTWEVNVLASMQLIEKAIDNGITQFIYASSGSVYGVKNEENVLNNTQWKIVFSDFEIGVYQTTLKSDGTFKYTVVEVLGPGKGNSYDKPTNTWMFYGTQFGMSFNGGYLKLNGTQSKNDYMEGTYETVRGDKGTWYGERKLEKEGLH